VQVSSSKTLSETVTNTGGTSVTISQVAATGSGFSVSGISVPVTLTAGQSATFNVLFSPTTAGAVSGNVAITSNGSNPTLNIPLTGTGVTAGALGSNPTSLAFGSVQVSGSKTLSETVTNTGGSISGVKFNDRNQNGMRDLDEEGLSDWVIYLDTNNNHERDVGETFTITDATGHYSFDNLATGPGFAYYVREVAQPGWFQVSNDPDVIYLLTNESRIDVNFGNSTISG
jgi:hypothetical protein